MSLYDGASCCYVLATCRMLHSGQPTLLTLAQMYGLRPKEKCSLSSHLPHFTIALYSTHPWMSRLGCLGSLRRPIFLNGQYKTLNLDMNKVENFKGSYTELDMNCNTLVRKVQQNVYVHRRRGRPIFLFTKR